MCCLVYGINGRILYVRIVLFELNIRLPFVHSEVVTKLHFWPNISIFDIKYELPYRPEQLLLPACD